MSAAQLRIFGDSNSGNCLKVKWIADALAIPYAWVEVDVVAGGSRTPEMLAINPAGQVPSVVLADGRALAQSNAILRYLARGSRLLPEESFTQAKIDEWLFWEQYSHEPYVAVARFRMRYLGEPHESLDAKLVDRGNAALDRLEQHLAGAAFLVGESMTIADIAILAYTRVAHEGGFDLGARAHVRRWIAACEAQLSLSPAVAA